jgi:hypothetical protein
MLWHICVTKAEQSPHFKEPKGLYISQENSLAHLPLSDTTEEVSHTAKELRHVRNRTTIPTHLSLQPAERLVQ